MNEAAAQLTNEKPKQLVFRALVYVPAALFFLFICLRGYLVSFTHDEAVTFLNYVTHSWGEILNVNYTNNHLLNSLLTKLSYSVFGSSEFALRLPNMLASLLFAVYATKLLRKILPGKTIWIFGLTAVCLNAFQIDFFSLCRGYGLSMGMIMTSFYFLYCYAEKPNRVVFAFLSLLAMMFAVLANYSTLLLFLLHISAIAFLELRFRIRFSPKEITLTKWRKGWTFLLILLMIFFAFMLIKLLLHIKSFGGENFNIGGTAGFWYDTVYSLGFASCLGEWALFFPVTGESFGELMMYFIAFVFALASIILLFRLVKNRNSVPNQFMLYLFLLLFFSGTGIWLMNKWLGIPFIEDRTAIYLIPVFSLFISLVLFAEGKASVARKLLAFLFFVHPVFSFGLKANLSVAENWKCNQGNREAIAILFQQGELSDCGSSHIVVATDYLMFPVYNYYRFRAEKIRFDELFFNDCGFREGADFYLGNENPGKSYKQIWSGTDCKLWQQTNCYCDSVLRIWKLNSAPEVQKLPDGTSGKAWVNEQDANHLSFIRDTIRDTIPAGNWIHIRAVVCAEKIYGSNITSFHVKRNENEMTSHMQQVDHLFRGMHNWNTIERWSKCQIDLLPGDVIETCVFALNESRIFVKEFEVRMIKREECERNR